MVANVINAVKLSLDNFVFVIVHRKSHRFQDCRNGIQNFVPYTLRIFCVGVRNMGIQKKNRDANIL